MSTISAWFYVINTLLSLGLYLVILRLWMQYARVSYYNPCAQFIIKITQPVIGPLRKILPSIGRLDTATCLTFYLIALVRLLAILYFINFLELSIWQYLIYTFLVMLNSIGHLIFWLLLIRAILSWVSRGNSILETLLAQLTEPLIAPIRRVVPPIANIDLSFMIFVFILIVLNMFFMSLFSPWWGIISL